MKKPRSRPRVGRIIYLVLMLVILAAFLWYFLPQYLDVLNSAATAD